MSAAARDMGFWRDDDSLADVIREHGLRLRRRRILGGMKDLQFFGAAAGDKVKVVLDGGGNVMSVTIDPQLLAPEAADALGELVVAACRNARHNCQNATNHALIKAGIPLDDDD